MLDFCVALSSLNNFSSINTSVRLFRCHRMEPRGSLCFSLFFPPALVFSSNPFFHHPLPLLPSTGPPIKAPTNVGVADGGAEGEAAVSWEYIVDPGEVVTGYRVSYVLDDGSGDASSIADSRWTAIDVGGGFRR